MRTLVISDIHIGNGSGYDIFAGREALPALLDSFTEPVRVVWNGDGVDFLMNEDPLTLDVDRAVEQARAIAGSPDGKPVFEALGRVLARGGEVMIRLGNHDVELFLPEVQAIFRAALAQPEAVDARLQFVNGDAPTILDVGGAKVLLAHGEHNDPWNRIDYASLAAGDYGGFAYPPGSRLVKTLLNPLKRQFGMRFSDLVKPDFQGGALAALAVDPTSVKTIFQGSTAVLVWQLLRRMNGPAAFNPDEEDVDLGLADRVDAADLTEEERLALEALIDPEGVGPMAFADDGVLDGAMMKLARTGMRLYATAHRALVDDLGVRFWELTPDPAEWTDARRLADKFGADAVLIGHTHAARFKQEDGVLFLNTGTWIWLMGTPGPDDAVEVWQEYLRQLRADPGLETPEGKALMRTSFTGALLEPVAGGANVSLVEWTPAGTLDTKRSGFVPAR